MRRLRTSEDGGEPPIFIGGHHRSGTTLLRVMLNRHPRIACGPEGQLFDRTSFLDFHRFLEANWIPRLRGHGLGEADIDRGIAAFINEFFARYAVERDKPRWAEKTPKNILYIEYLFRLFPNARFIHMIRDPRDIHCSVIAKARTDTPRWRDVAAESTARGWVRRIEAGARWEEDPRYIEVRYEDLSRHPSDVMERILSFLDEPWDERVLQPEQPAAANVPNVNQPVFGTSVGRWRADLSDVDAAVIETVAGPIMRTLGYALERNEIRNGAS